MDKKTLTKVPHPELDKIRGGEPPIVPGEYRGVERHVVQSDGDPAPELIVLDRVLNGTITIVMGEGRV